MVKTRRNPLNRDEREAAAEILKRELTRTMALEQGLLDNVRHDVS